MRVLQRIVLLFFLTFSSCAVDEKPTILSFGHTFAKWCTELLNEKGEWNNKLLPLFSRPKIFNEIPEILNSDFEENVKKALNALYGIRDSLVTDENIQNEVKKWKVVKVEEEVYNSNMESNEFEEDGHGHHRDFGDFLDLADKIGEREEMARQNARKKSKHEWGKITVDDYFLTPQFPFNPKHLPWEDKNKFGKMQDTPDMKAELKTTIRIVAEFLFERLKKIKGHVNLMEIVKEKELMEVGNKWQIGGRKGKGTKRKQKGNGTEINYKSEQLYKKFNEIIKINAKAKKPANLRQNRTLVMPPSDNEKEVKLGEGDESKYEKEKKKCIWIMQILNAQEFNGIGEVEKYLLKQYPEFNINFIYRKVENVFENKIEQKLGKSGSKNGRNSPTMEKSGSKNGRNSPTMEKSGSKNGRNSPTRKRG